MTNEEMQKWVTENTELTNYEWVRSRLYMRLLPKTFDPRKMAVRTSADKFWFDGLVIAPYIRLACDENDDGLLSASVNPALLDVWGVTKEQVFTEAHANSYTEGKIEPMSEALSELSELLGTDVIVEEKSPLYIVSNKTRMFGAFAIITEAPMLERMFPEGYIVFPSSVHECIVMSKNNYIPEMNDIVACINMTMPDADVLSDKVYEF